MYTVIAVRSEEGRLVVPIGKDQAFNREGRSIDIILGCRLHIDVPLIVAISIRTDGSWVWWYSEWSEKDAHNYGSYWHFRNLSEEIKTVTEAQQVTIAKMLYGHIRPFGISAIPNAPVQHKVFAGLSTEQMEALGNAGERAVYNIAEGRPPG